ncbi:hypothetical protein EC968_004972 [Mortierella alpina]|nr:hypothetical protein EC968_004972 [Mortierella alpina]
MSTALLIRTLQDLKNGGTASSARSRDLDALAKRLQIDEDFRVEIGQVESVWKDLASILSKVIKDALDPEHVQELMYICRIIRNGVAGVTKNQNQARTAKLPQQIQEVVSQAAHTHYGNDAWLQAWAVIKTYSAGRKLLVRLINESSAVSAKEERKSFEMIYTLFNHLISQGFFKELFDALAASDEVDGLEDYKIRYHGENILDRDEHEDLPKIKNLKVEENEDQETIKQGTPQSYLRTEQVVLLKMLDSRIYAHHERLQEQYQAQQQHTGHPIAAANEPSAASHVFKVDETEPAVDPATVDLLSNVFAKVSASTIEVLRTLDQPGVGGHGVEDLANLSSGLMLLLGCFSHLCLHEENFGTDVRHGSVDGDGTADDQAYIDMGRGHQAVQRLPDWFKAQHMTMVNAGLVENAIGQQSFFVGLKRDIVRLVGNLAYRSRHVQDRIRKCNGLIVMLSQCNIDDANPYLREYAILAMKNILNGNPQNQALIEELQPIEAVDHPALQEARVTSRLDAETGRPVLSQKARPS